MDVAHAGHGAGQRGDPGRVEPGGVEQHRNVVPEHLPGGMTDEPDRHQGRHRIGPGNPRPDGDEGRDHRRGRVEVGLGVAGVGVEELAPEASCPLRCS